MTKKLRRAVQKKKLTKKYNKQQGATGPARQTNKNLLRRSARIEKIHDDPYDMHAEYVNPFVTRSTNPTYVPMTTPAPTSTLANTNIQTPNSISELRQKLSIAPAQGTLNIIPPPPPKYVNLPGIRETMKKAQERRKYNPPANSFAEQWVRTSYFPQQYGNYTNDRAYNDLQQQYRNLSVASNMNQVTLKNMNSANKTLEDDIKKQHQQIQDAQKRKNELQEKLDKEKSDLAEGSRVERETRKLQNDISNTEQQIRETQKENKIVELKIQKLQAIRTNNMVKTKNTKLKEKLDENELYNETKELEDETAKLVAENVGLQKEIESPEFQHPNAALEQAYKEKLAAEDQQKLLQEQHDLNLTANETKAELSVYESQTPKDEQALTEQAKNIAQKKTEIRKKQREIQQIKNKEKQKEKLEDENAQLDVDINVNSAEVQQLKENANDEELSRISQEAGRTKGKKFMSDANVNKTKQISNMNDEIMQNTAETTELNKHNSPQQAKLNRNLGETKTKLEQTQELLQTTKEEKASEKQRQIAEGASQYYSSPDYNKTDKKIASMKTATKINMRQKEMIELADKKQDQAIQSLHDLQAAEDARGIDTNDINDESAIAYQISNAVKIAQDGIDKEARNREEKESKISEVQEYISQNSSKWEHFVSGDRYRKYANFRYSPYAFDIQTIDQLYSDFLKYSKFNFPDDNTNNIEEEEED